MTTPIPAEMTILKPVLSRSQQSYLKIAMRIAEASECTQRHGALVVRGGSVLSTGLNKWRNDVIPTSILEDSVRDGNLSVHAEIDALSRLRNTKGATMYIARINRRGIPRLSKPCANCAKAIREAGITKVIYTTSYMSDFTI